MIDNAVAHYEHLIEQGKSIGEAMDHCVQRYGVSRDVMVQRLSGRVFRHKATMEALAEARAYLTTFIEPGQGTREGLILRNLYNALTGEDLRSPTS